MLVVNFSTRPRPDKWMYWRVVATSGGQSERVTAGGGASHLLPGRSRREKYVNRAANWIYLSARRGGNLRPAGGRRVEEPPAGGPVWEPAGGAGYSLSSGAPCTSRGCR